jgi:hypothetical protein
MNAVAENPRLRPRDRYETPFSSYGSDYRDSGKQFIVIYKLGRWARGPELVSPVFKYYMRKSP